MKFDNAYCKELKHSISPYNARDIYFDETNTFYNQKLTFECEDCGVQLVPVNIYKIKKFKQALHFRTKKKEHHKSSCPFAFSTDLKNKSTTDAINSYRYKNKQYISEFILERPKRNNSSNQISTENNKSNEKNTQTIRTAKNNRSSDAPIKTSSFEHVVDCYLLLKEKNDLDQNILLTINGKSKYYRNYFKRIKYFQNEKGLIYYGEVKGLKKYGQNYKIIFKERCKYNNEDLQISIYIENEDIENYRKKKQFRAQLEELTKSEDKIICFFVGAYPVRESINYKGNEFDVFNVNITNFDHIVFIFNERMT